MDEDVEAAVLAIAADPEPTTPAAELVALPMGVPKRSTPSLAAEMRAEPSMEGSKRVGRFEAPIEAAAEVLRLPRPRP